MGTSCSLYTHRIILSKLFQALHVEYKNIYLNIKKKKKDYSVFLTMYPPKAIWQVIFTIYSFIARRNVPKVARFLYAIGWWQWF